MGYGNALDFVVVVAVVELQPYSGLAEAPGHRLTLSAPGPDGPGAMLFHNPHRH